MVLKIQDKEVATFADILKYMKENESLLSVKIAVSEGKEKPQEAPISANVKE